MVVLYADRMTGAMKRAIDESNRRRRIQQDYNEENHITPKSIQKNIDNVLSSAYEADYVTVPAIAEEEKAYLTPDRIREIIQDLEGQMKEAAKNLEFEEAARLRDEMMALQELELEISG